MGRHAVVKDSDQRVVDIIEWDGVAAWQPPVGHSVRPAADGEGPWTPPPPTDDELIAQQPRKQRLAPTAAAGKAALRDLLDEQVQVAAGWRWFADAVQADTDVPAAAKTAVAGLATGEYTEAKRLLLAWRAAT